MRIHPGLLWLLAIPAFPVFLYYSCDLKLIILLGFIYFLGQKFFGGFSLDGLESRAVFISGCDTGFGRELVLKLLEKGIPTFAGCLTEAGALSLRTAAKSLPGKLDTLLLDVSDDESVSAAARYLDKATEPFGGLHAVVNNAGVAGLSFLDDLLTVADYKNTAEVNTYGVIRVTQALKHLVKKTKGRIVTVSSIVDRLGIMGSGPYTVSKYAVSGYCEVIRQELSFFGVSVHIIEPGFFKTPMTDGRALQARLDQVWERAPKRTKEEYGETFFRDSRERAGRLLDKSTSPETHLVVEAYIHAITARFPRLRYQVGKDAQFFFLPISMLPSGLKDSIFRVIDCLSGAPIPASAR